MKHFYIHVNNEVILSQSCHVKIQNKTHDSIFFLSK